LFTRIEKSLNIYQGVRFGFEEFKSEEENRSAGKAFRQCVVSAKTESFIRRNDSSYAAADHDPSIADK